MSGPNKTFAREAAAVELGKLLATKKRGDRVTAAEIREATGFENWQSFRGRIFTWAKNEGLVPFAVARDGWRFGTAAEHVDFAERKRKSALRSDERGLKACLDTPQVELDDVQTRRLNFVTMRAARRVSDARRDDKDTRAEFRLDGERIPLRAIVGGKTV